MATAAPPLVSARLIPLEKDENGETIPPAVISKENDVPVELGRACALFPWVRDKKCSRQQLKIEWTNENQLKLIVVRFILSKFPL